MDISNILGFKNVALAEAQEADSVVDMTQGFALLYVYMNVVDPRMIGGTRRAAVAHCSAGRQARRNGLEAV